MQKRVIFKENYNFVDELHEHSYKKQNIYMCSVLFQLRKYYVLWLKVKYRLGRYELVTLATYDICSYKAWMLSILDIVCHVMMYVPELKTSRTHLKKDTKMFSDTALAALVMNVGRSSCVIVYREGDFSPWGSCELSFAILLFGVFASWNKCQKLHIRHFQLIPVMHIQHTRHKDQLK